MPLQFNALLFRLQHYIAITSSQEEEEIVITGIDLWHKNGSRTQKESSPSKWNNLKAFATLLLWLQEAQLNPITLYIDFG